jgi:3-oxoacyl-[acyl-carrier protein] reductase
MSEPPVIVITGTRKGIGAALAEHYLDRDWRVVGCSRGPASIQHERYTHFSLDIGEERAVVAMIREVGRRWGAPWAVLNNAGIASMNAALLTPGSSLETIFRTNCFGAFYVAREAAKLMLKRRQGRIVFFTTVARPLQLEGELAYAASKAAVESMTQVLARELGGSGITVNAVGPTPVRTDLIAGVPEASIEAIVARQAIGRIGEMRDVTNVVDFFVRPESDFVTGQVVYLGGIG